MTLRHIMALLPTAGLLSCAPSPPTTAMVKPSLPQTEAECLSRGGEWILAGPQNVTRYCFLRTKDGGKACTSSRQCESECVEHETGNYCAESFDGCLQPTGRGTATQCVN
jgi:hypothetical protein